MGPKGEKGMKGLERDCKAILGLSGFSNLARFHFDSRIIPVCAFLKTRS